MRIITW